MILNTLILELGNCTMSIMPKTDLKTDFAQIKLYTPGQEVFSEQIIYFCKWTDLVSERIPEKFTVVLWDDRPDHEADDITFLDQFYGGLIVPTKKDFDYCYQCFEQCYLLAYQADQCINQIADTIYNYGDLQTLANQIAEMYDHPMNIVDNAFHVMTSSNNYEFFSEDLARDNQSGFIPPEILKRLNLSLQRRRNSQSKTIVIDHIHGQFQNYFTPILNNDIALGYFSIFLRPNEEMSPLLKQYLPRIARLLGSYFQRLDFSRSSRSNYYTTLLSSLLSENPLLNNMEEERFQLFGYRMKKFKYIFVIDIARENPEDFVLSDISDIFKQIFGNCIYTIQHNQIIYLASYDELIEETDLLKERCENQLLSTPYVNVGVSSPYTILAESRGHFNEAKAAIEAGIMFHSKEQVFFFDEYRLMHMVQSLGHFTDIRMFSLPQLRLLKEHDSIKEGSLLHTLYIFICHNGDISRICEKLHIHRNTLYFRLNKISEITHLNLGDAETRAMILISFRIMRMQSEIDWEL